VPRRSDRTRACATAHVTARPRRSPRHVKGSARCLCTPRWMPGASESLQWSSLPARRFLALRCRKPRCAAGKCTLTNMAAARLQHTALHTPRCTTLHTPRSPGSALQVLLGRNGEPGHLGWRGAPTCDALATAVAHMHGTRVLWGAVRTRAYCSCMAWKRRSELTLAHACMRGRCSVARVAVSK
jgi:hypothetical protein